MASEMRIGSVYIGRTLEEVRDKNSEFNKFTKRFSDYTCRNTFQYVSEPTRSDDFELQNEDITTGYVPEVSFTFKAINEEVYRTFIQIVNSKGFFVAYYDYELGADVIRKVYMSEKDLQRVQFAPPNSKMQDGTISKLGYIQRLIGLSVTFVSKFGYSTYQELLDTANYDERYAYEEEVSFDENLSALYSTYGLGYHFDTITNKYVLDNTFSPSEADSEMKEMVWYRTYMEQYPDQEPFSMLEAYTNKSFTYATDGSISGITYDLTRYRARNYS